MKNQDNIESEFDPIWPIAEEFSQRCKRGEEPSIEEYARRHPEMADAIRSFFPTLQAIDDLEHQPSPESRQPSIGKSRLTHAEVISRHEETVRPEIPNYQIFQEIGRGGMGVVYEAEQLSLGRRVALKVLPSALRQNELAVSRFRQEARSAASLHHSNIVPVFEVGSTDQHNYYAMQYIVGDGLDRVIKTLRQKTSAVASKTAELSKQNVATDVTSQIITAITSNIVDSQTSGEFDDDFELSPDRPKAEVGIETGKITSSTTTTLSALKEKNRFHRNVARIGVEVGEALAHAHDQKVIHRDIKPSNILLDTSGRPWVADFGLAKSANVELTQTGNILGTLRYMSPERFTGICGPRGDVYGLGATLYEMLTLEPLYPGKDQLTLIDQIKSDSPVSMRDIDRSIPFDLETIVNKALEKVPSRRYATAQQLADDLQRFLEGRPIHARRVGTFEKIGLWAKSNRMTAALLCVLTMGLIAVSIGSLIAANNYRNLFLKEQGTAIAAANATELANEKANLAELESDTKEAINRFFRQLINASDAQVNAKDISLRELLINTRDNIGFEDKPIIQGEIRRTIGKALSSLGQFKEAGEQLHLSQELLEKALGKNDDKTMQTTMELGRYYRDREEADKAIPYTTDYYEYAFETFGPEDPKTIQAMHMMAMILDEVGKSDQAEEFFISVATWRRKHLGESNKDTINTIGALGSLYLYEHRLKKAEPWVKEGAALSMEHLGPEDFTTMVLNHNLSQLYLYQKRYDEAEPRLLEDYERTQRLLGENHQGAIITLGKIADLYKATDRIEKAIVSKKQQLEKSKITFGPDSGMTFGYKLDLARFYKSNSQLKLARSQTEATLKEAVDRLGNDDWTTQKCRAELASLDSDAGNYDEAIEAFSEVYAFASKKFGKTNKRSWQYLSKLADCYYLNQEFEQARDAKQTIVEFLKERGELPDSLLEARRILFLSHLKLQDYPTSLRIIENGLDQIESLESSTDSILEFRGKFQLYKVVCLNELQEFEDAFKLSKEMLDSKSYPKSKAYYFDRLNALQGRSLLGLGNLAEAESMLLAGHKGLEENGGGRYATTVAEWLVELYRAMEKPDEVAKWQAAVEDDTLKE